MVKRTLVNVLLVLALASPAFAASKSTTVRVSCSIPERIEMVSRGHVASRAVEVHSTIEDRWQMTDGMRTRDGRREKLYSLCAL